MPKVDSVESVCLGSSEERTWDKLAGNESEGINQWLTNKLDNMTPNNLMFTRICKTFQRDKGSLIDAFISSCPISGLELVV